MVFLFHDTSTTDIYTLSLTTLFRSFARSGAYSCRRCEYPERTPSILDLRSSCTSRIERSPSTRSMEKRDIRGSKDRKSTRLNSSHSQISYAVFCLKKKRPSSESRHT